MRTSSSSRAKSVARLTADLALDAIITMGQVAAFFLILWLTWFMVWVFA